MDKRSGATRLSASSSKERARLSGVQLSSFSLSFDFFVSSSARVPVNVYDNLPVITELPKGTVISCVTSYGSEPDYYVHVGTSEVKKKKKQKKLVFFCHCSLFSGRRAAVSRYKAQDSIQH